MKAFTIIIVVGLLVVGAIAIFGSSSDGRVSSITYEAELPEATNYAVDTAGSLTNEQLDALNERLKGIADAGDIEIAVAVVDSIEPLTIEDYGIKLAEKWQVGPDDTDRGAIIIVATGDRLVRIEVGYGLEGEIPDGLAGEMIDVLMVPHLKNGDWYSAIDAGITGIVNESN